MSEYLTSEMGEATALSCLGFDIVSITGDRRKKQFVFDETPELHKAVNNYWTKKLKVDALSFYNEFQLLRSRIINLKKYD